VSDCSHKECGAYCTRGADRILADFFRREAKRLRQDGKIEEAQALEDQIATNEAKHGGTQ